MKKIFKMKKDKKERKIIVNFNDYIFLFRVKAYKNEFLSIYPDIYIRKFYICTYFIIA